MFFTGFVGWILPDYLKYENYIKRKSTIPRCLDFSRCLLPDGRYFCPSSPTRIYKNKRNLKRHIKYECNISLMCHLCQLLCADKEELLTHMWDKHTERY